MAGLQSWVSEHKLASIAAVWASAIGGSMAYTRRKSPLKTSLRLIHARMHAQAFTLAVLSSAAAYHYYENHGGGWTVNAPPPPPGIAATAEEEMLHYPDIYGSDW